MISTYLTTHIYLNSYFPEFATSILTILIVLLFLLGIALAIMQGLNALPKINMTLLAVGNIVLLFILIILQLFFELKNIFFTIANAPPDMKNEMLANGTSYTLFSQILPLFFVGILIIVTAIIATVHSGAKNKTAENSPKPSV
ncbi:MAG: hypothetical protein JW841_05355 [Deltaproteobacteria bacterium]|nr:hypothetical protein [Deltaproteobacteria bacterium]